MNSIKEDGGGGVMEDWWGEGEGEKKSKRLEQSYDALWDGQSIFLDGLHVWIDSPDETVQKSKKKERKKERKKITKTTKRCRNPLKPGVEPRTPSDICMG